VIVIENKIQELTPIPESVPTLKLPSGSASGFKAGTSSRAVGYITDLEEKTTKRREDSHQRPHLVVLLLSAAKLDGDQRVFAFASSVHSSFVVPTCFYLTYLISMVTVFSHCADHRWTPAVCTNGWHSSNVGIIQSRFVSNRRSFRFLSYRTPLNSKLKNNLKDSILF
jgi:hypothetical protein